MDKKKIIHWSFIFFPHLGGLSTHIDSLVKNMPEFEHEIITNHRPNTKLVERFSKNSIIKRFQPTANSEFQKKWLRKRSSLMYGAFCEIFRSFKQKQYLNNSDFDILHVHENNHDLNILDLALKTNFFSKISQYIYDFKKIEKPTLMTRHFMFAKGYMHSRFEEWEIETLNRFDNIIFPTMTGYEKYVKYFEATNQKKNIWYIPNSVDTEIFKFKPVSKTNNNNTKLKIGCVSRLSADKGQYFLIEILKNLPDYVDFHFACSADVGTIDNLRRAFDKPNVHIYANVDYNKISDFYHNVDIVLNTTMVVANDRVIPEAMSCGRPVIAIDVGENCHVFDGKTGFLIKPDVKELINLMSYLHENRNKLNEMGQNARKLAESKFSNKVIIPKIKNIYELILE